MLNFCAIDPGANGAFAWINQDMFKKGVYAEKMPKDTKKLFQLIKDIPVENFIIEAVNLRPQDLAGGKVFVMQKLIFNFHKVKTLIELAGKKYILVMPSHWQRGFMAHNPNLRGDDRKRELKNICNARFPDYKATLWSCDAILILDFLFQEKTKASNWFLEKTQQAKIK